MNVLVFDIETVPDVLYGRALLGLGDLPDAEVAKAMAAQRRQQTGGSEFLPLEQQRIVAIACALRSADQLKVWSLGEVESGEAELVQRFFDGIGRIWSHGMAPDLICRY
jgi:3'-5' exonuclease